MCQTPPPSPCLCCPQSECLFCLFEILTLLEGQFRSPHLLALPSSQRLCLRPPSLVFLSQNCQAPSPLCTSCVPEGGEFAGAEAPSQPLTPCRVTNNGVRGGGVTALANIPAQRFVGGSETPIRPAQRALPLCFPPSTQPWAATEKEPPNVQAKSASKHGWVLFFYHFP